MVNLTNTFVNDFKKYFTRNKKLQRNENNHEPSYISKNSSIFEEKHNKISALNLDIFFGDNGKNNFTTFVRNICG